MAYHNLLQILDNCKYFDIIQLLKEMIMQNKLTESLEAYLLSIDTLSESKDKISVKDVYELMGLKGPATSDAVKKLSSMGYIKYVPYYGITLLEKGKKAIEIKRYRHSMISDFLNNVLGIDKKHADLNANSIEYSMTEDVLNRFVNFLNFMKTCSCKEPKWIKSCKKSLEKGKLSDVCKSCIMSNKNNSSMNCCCKK